MSCKECPACGGKRTKADPERIQIRHCTRCEAIFGTCYLGDSYSLVLPYWADKEVAPEKLRYYDFTTLGSEGIGRRHGWYDPETRLTHQIG